MKNKKWILFAPIVLLTLAMSAWLAKDIYEENARIQRIKGVDAKVVTQLQKIRIAQQAYLSVHKTYCNDWSELLSFLDTGKFVNIQTKERVMLLSSGKDSVIRTMDTIAVFSVFDSLSNQLKFISKEDLPNLIRVPVSDTVFTLRADKLPNGQNICEVRDPQPLNPRRQKKGDLQPLQIGSLEISTLQGNWE